MPVLLRTSADLPAPSRYDHWYAVTGGRGRGPADRKLPDLARRLEEAFNAISPEWWAAARSLSEASGAELAYATTCAAFGSDFGLMMAWARLTTDEAAGTGTCLVVCDDPCLFRHLAGLPGVDAGRAPPLWPWLGVRRLRGFAARLGVAGRMARAAAVTRGQRPAHGRGDPVILVYGHPRSTAEGLDAYFGSLMAEIPALRRLLHTDCPPARARQLAADGRTAVLHAWGRPWPSPALLWARWRPRHQDLDGPLGWLVRRAAAIEGSGGAAVMNAWQRKCHDAWLADVRPRVVAWPWENHGWERDFCRVARRRGVRTVGYQHTVIGPHQLNYAPVTNFDGLDSLPDLIVCDGAAYRDQLLDWGVPADRMVVGGSLRIGRVEADLYDPDGPVFVALSARRSIARQQVAAVDKAAARGFRFLVKAHPMYPLTLTESNHVRRTDRILPEHEALSAVVYSTGTSGLEGLLAGLPTFRLLPEDEIAVDVLPPFAAAVPVTADDLADALAADQQPSRLDWDSVLSPPDGAFWRDLFGPTP